MNARATAIRKSKKLTAKQTITVLTDDLDGGAAARTLESVGYPFAPRYLGVDSHARDVFGYVPGTATDHPASGAATRTPWAAGCYANTTMPPAVEF